MSDALRSRLPRSGRLFQTLTQRRRAQRFPDTIKDQPLRGELFSLEQLEEHARILAAEHRVGDQRGRIVPMARMLRQHERHLQHVYTILAEDTRTHTTITPAAEWFLDNFPVVMEQVREIREDLPAGYYQGFRPV